MFKKITLSLVALFFCSKVFCESFPFINVEGDAELEVKPDLFEVTLVVKSYSEDPTKGKDKINNCTGDFLVFLIENDFDTNNVESFKIDKSTVHKKENYQNKEIIGYSFERIIKIFDIPIDRYSLLINRVLRDENIVNQNCTFTSSEEDSIKQELVEQAARDATSKAKRIAKSFNTSIDRVYAISEKSFDDLDAEFSLNSNLVLRRMTARPSSIEDNYLVPNTISYSTTIYAKFKLK